MQQIIKYFSRKNKVENKIVDVKNELSSEPLEVENFVRNGMFSVVKDGAVGGKLSCRENSGERSSVRDPIWVSTLVELFGVKRTEPPLVVRNVF